MLVRALSLAVIAVLALAPVQTVLGKNKQRKAYDRSWKKRRRRCELETCAHLDLMENDNCVHNCTSVTCYDSTYAEEPLEPGEVDSRRERTFTSCALAEEKRKASEGRSRRRAEAAKRKEAVAAATSAAHVEQVGAHAAAAAPEA